MSYTQYKYLPFSNPKKINPNAPWWAKTKKRLILNQTSQEILFYQTIKSLYPKLKILPQKTLKANGKRYFLDFYIPRIKLAIEIDGDYHKKRTKEDSERDYNLLTKKSINTLRFTNTQIDTDCIEIAKEIISML